jgi:hypothetical protein
LSSVWRCWLDSPPSFSLGVILWLEQSLCECVRVTAIRGARYGETGNGLESVDR